MSCLFLLKIKSETGNLILKRGLGGERFEALLTP